MNDKELILHLYKQARKQGEFLELSLKPTQTSAKEYRETLYGEVAKRYEDDIKFFEKLLDNLELKEKK